MVEPMETRVKSEEGDEKNFAPKFNKKKNSGKSNAASVPIEMCQNYSGEWSSL